MKWNYDYIFFALGLSCLWKYDPCIPYYVLSHEILEGFESCLEKYDKSSLDPCEKIVDGQLGRGRRGRRSQPQFDDAASKRTWSR